MVLIVFFILDFPSVRLAFDNITRTIKFNQLMAGLNCNSKVILNALFVRVIENQTVFYFWLDASLLK